MRHTQNHRNTKRSLTRISAVALALTVALSGSAAPKAMGQEVSEIPSEACTASDEGQLVQLPYSYIAAAEALVDDGIIDSELIAVLESVDINYEVVGPAPRALPLVAAAAVAVVAWCAKGALSSLAPSALQQAAHQAHSGIEPPGWIMNAIFGCAGGPVFGALTSQALRIKFAAAVLATVIKLRNFG